MLKRLKKISEEVLHENPWWTYKHDQYEKPTGGTGDYYYAETNGMVKIVPMLPDGTILLTLQHRYLFDKQSIEFPAGGILDGEEVLEAAKREMLEEVGATATEWIKIGVVEPSNGFVRDTAHIFLAIVDQHGLNRSHDDEEEIDVMVRRIDDVEHMVATNEMWDGMSITTWALARKFVFERAPYAGEH